MRGWLVPVLLAACGDDPELSTNERALAGDGLRSVDAEAIIGDTVEQSFSGLIQHTPDPEGQDVYAPLHAAAQRSIEAAQTRLTPSGCLQAIKSPAGPSNPVIDYTLTSCSADGHTLTGTVTTTWVLDETIRVVHDIALDVDGVAMTGSLTLDVFQADPETRQRAYSIESAGIVIDGSWSASYGSDGCGTKTGLATVTAFGGRTFERTDTLTFCDAETLDALEGTLDLSRDGLEIRVKLGDNTEVFTRGELFPIRVEELLE